MNGSRTHCMRVSLNSSCSSEMEMVKCVCAGFVSRKTDEIGIALTHQAFSIKYIAIHHSRFRTHKWILQLVRADRKRILFIASSSFCEKGANEGGGNDAFNKISSVRFHCNILSSVIGARIFQEKRIQKSRKVEGRRQSSEEIGQRNDEKSPSFIFCDG